MATQKGTVKWFNNEKGYGFIAPEDGGKDVFVHIRDVKDSHYETLGDNDTVSYDLEEGYNGKSKATNIKILN